MMNGHICMMKGCDKPAIAWIDGWLAVCDEHWQAHLADTRAKRAAKNAEHTRAREEQWTTPNG
jgi:hypothetical protein